jgi:Ca2+-binding RTX toxin-like protein
MGLSALSISAPWVASASSISAASVRSLALHAGTVVKGANSVASTYVMPAGHLNITAEDLKFMLDQIKIGEAHSDRTATAPTTLQPGILSLTPTTIIYPYDVKTANRCLSAADIASAGTLTYGATGLSNVYPFSTLNPWGVREVTGACNNIHSVLTENPTTYTFTSQLNDSASWGAGDQVFPRIAPATNNPTQPGPYSLNNTQQVYATPGASINDPQPRLISNLISDSSSNNPAAVAAATMAASILYGALPTHQDSINAGNGRVTDMLSIPNITPDYNVSAGYNSWFTLFGQFFDHGLDLIPKAGPSVFIPVDQSDPLYSASPYAPNEMILTRGADPVHGDSVNITTPYIDQSQSYGSHPSQNFFLREYTFASTSGLPTPTGRLLEGTDSPYPTNDNSGGYSLPTSFISTSGGVYAPSNGGMPTWRDMKAQAHLLGINLTDWDIRNIPIIATDQYGKFIPAPTGTKSGKDGTTNAAGFPMMLFTDGTRYIWEAGTPVAPISTGNKTANSPVVGVPLAGQSGLWHAVNTEHNFINDTQANAVPFSQSGSPLAPDTDTVMNSINTYSATLYDNESLDGHLIAGDGRINENIGLASIHAVFHSEHNLVATDIENLISAPSGTGLTTQFKSEWKNPDGSWNGNRIYQAARMVMEMEYQHMVYDEFVRRIAPSLPLFVAYDQTINANITQEFASAVYRLGHSMLTETIARSNPGTFYDPTNNQDVSLISGFTNPIQYRMRRPMNMGSAISNGTSITYSMIAGELTPPVGSTVSLSGFVNPAFNILNAVVASVPTASTFVVAQYYAANSDALTNISLSPSDSATVTAISPNALATTLAQVAVNDPGVSVGSNVQYDYSPQVSAAAVAQGMSTQRGNEIDEFVTDAVRNNLLGLPLDLPSLNITRGRDVGLPTLNQFRAYVTSTGKAHLPAYSNWGAFINPGLRYKESGANFIAAYGTHPYVTTHRVALSTGAISNGTSIVYTLPPSAEVNKLKVNDVISVSGFINSAYNLKYGVIASIDTTTAKVTVTNRFAVAPSAAVITNDPTGARPAAIAITAPSAGPAVNGASAFLNGASAFVTRETTNAEKRAAATSIVNGATTGISTPVVGDATQSISAPADWSQFLYNSAPTGAPCDYPDGSSTCIDWTTTETGLNSVDLWMGGLAENPAKQPVTPPMLPPTFQFVFADQMLKMQNGDRFYYLGRLAGTNMGSEIPGQKFSDIVKRNTPSTVNNSPTVTATGTISTTGGIYGMADPGFGVSDCAYAALAGEQPASTPCTTGTWQVLPDNSANHFGLDNVTIFQDQTSAVAGVYSSPSTPTTLVGGGGDDSIQGGPGNDKLIGGLGGDLLLGGAGDDIIFGGPGEDLLQGGPGNDVINAGENQLGDIADGGSGSDWITSGNSQGIDTFDGEAGNDFIQGGIGSDLVLNGGEGNDWIEGGADIDGLNGDMGLNGGGGTTIAGGDDILDGGAGNDLVGGDGGDDILMAGNGFDGLTGGTGFNWINYQNAVRKDLTTSPSIWLDMSGLALNPPLNQDGAAEISGVSGSPGDDSLHGGPDADVSFGPGGNVTVAPAVSTVTGVAGTTTLSVTPIDTRLAVGAMVSGVGIAPNAVVAGVAQTTTGMTVTLSDANIGTVTGLVKFTTWPMQNPGLITGLQTLVENTPGWNKAITAAASDFSTTGITSPATAAKPAATYAGNYLTVTASDSSIPVGALVSVLGTSPSASITGAVSNGSVITYTTLPAHGLSIGQIVNISGVNRTSGKSLNIAGAVIASTPSATTFTVVDTAGFSSSGTGGTAVRPFGQVVSNDGLHIQISSLTGGSTMPAPWAATNKTIIFTPLTQWSGGNIILGGGGSDTITPSAGADVIDGAAALNVCLLVSGVVGNTPCASGLGFSGMTDVTPYLESGAVNPTQVSTVREINNGPISPTSNVVYPGTKASYTVTKVDTYYLVTGPKGSATGPSYTDIVRNVSNLFFAGDVPQSTTMLSPTIKSLSIVTTTLPTATYGMPYRAKLLGGQGVGNYVWSMTTTDGTNPIVTGLSINPTTGEISGSPTIVATAPQVVLTVTLIDTLGGLTQSTATHTYNLTIAPKPITISAVSQGIGLGSIIPLPTFNVSGLVGSDVINPASLVLTNSVGSAGTTPIVVTTGTITVAAAVGGLQMAVGSSANYVATYRPGRFVVAGHSLLISISNLPSSVNAGAVPNFVLSQSGLQGGDALATGTPLISYSGVTSSGKGYNSSVFPYLPGSYSATPVDFSLTVPAHKANYAPNFVSTNFTVVTGLPTIPNIIWSNPENITVGTALSATQLNATADSGVPSGQCVYSPPAGTVLSVGNFQVLTCTYNFTSGSNGSWQNSSEHTVLINVLPATSPAPPSGGGGVMSAPTPAPIVTTPLVWKIPSSIDDSTLVSSDNLLSATVGTIPGTIVYTIDGSTPLNANVTLGIGSHRITASFTPRDSNAYTAATKTLTFDVTATNTTPAILWPAPSAITYGTAISDKQLNATSGVPGTFSYSPPVGSILPVGIQTLFVTFKPNDSSKYATAISSVSLQVMEATSNPAPTPPPTANQATGPKMLAISVSAKGILTKQGLAQLIKAIHQSATPLAITVSVPNSNMTPAAALTLAKTWAKLIGNQIRKSYPSAKFAIKAVGSKVQDVCQKFTNGCITF